MDTEYVLENADVGTVVTELKNGNTVYVPSILINARSVWCRDAGMLNTEPKALTVTFGYVARANDDAVLIVVPIDFSTGLNAIPALFVDKETTPICRLFTTTLSDPDRKVTPVAEIAVVAREGVPVFTAERRFV